MVSNPNLEYDPLYLELQTALRGKPERGHGDRILPAEPPDWTDVAERAEALAARTQDLFVEVARVRADAHREGLAGLANGWRRLANLLRAEWGTLHPHPDEDHGDPIRRLNILNTLTANDSGVLDLRDSIWIRTPRVGSCTVREAEQVLSGRATSNQDEEGKVLDRPQLTALVREAVAEGQPNVAQEALDALGELGSALEACFGAGRGLDLSPLVNVVGPLASFHGAESGGGSQGQVERRPLQAPPDVTVESGGAHSTTTGIRSRQDVVRALDQVCAYLEREEPTNPAPLMIRRAQRLMQMSFVDIVREMAPEGMDSVGKVLGPLAKRDDE